MTEPAPDGTPSREELDRLLTEKPGDSGALTQRAGWRILEQDWKGVVADFEAVLAADPKAGFEGKLAAAYARLGDAEAAEREFARELSHRADAPYLLWSRADFRHDRDDLPGALEDMLEANRIILDGLAPRTDGVVEDSDIAGKVVIEAGARVVKSTVRGPAIIGKGARIESAYIGPFTSIGDGVVVRGSEVEHSIVLEGASISDIGGRIESSLIGRNASIYRSARKPRSFNFMLGDRSEVGLV